MHHAWGALAASWRLVLSALAWLPWKTLTGATGCSRHAWTLLALHCLLSLHLHHLRGFADVSLDGTPRIARLLHMHYMLLHVLLRILHRVRMHRHAFIHHAVLHLDWQAHLLSDILEYFRSQSRSEYILNQLLKYRR
jgi:hypothetical protein